MAHAEITFLAAAAPHFTWNPNPCRHGHIWTHLRAFVLYPGQHDREDLRRSRHIIVNSGPGTLGDTALQRCFGYAAPGNYISSSSCPALHMEPQSLPSWTHLRAFVLYPGQHDREDLRRSRRIIVNSGPGTLGDTALQHCFGYAAPGNYIFSSSCTALHMEPQSLPSWTHLRAFVLHPGQHDREDLRRSRCIIVNSGPGTLGDTALQHCFGYAAPKNYISSSSQHQHRSTVRVSSPCLSSSTLREMVH